MTISPCRFHAITRTRELSTRWAAGPLPSKDRDTLRTAHGLVGILPSRIDADLGGDRLTHPDRAG